MSRRSYLTTRRSHPSSVRTRTYVLVMSTPIEIKRDPRGQGERGEQLAAAWFIDREIEVFVPLLHTPRDFDFTVDWGEGPKRVQVKTSTLFRKGRWEVAICTR